MRHLNVLGDQFFNDFFTHSQAQAIQKEWLVQEHESHFMLTLDLPGTSKEDTKIEVKENVLTISGTRRNPFINEDGQIADFSRRFTLPPGVESDRIEARFVNGVLGITVPKAEKVKSRLIEISA